MKKLFLFVTLLIIIHSNGFSQDCLPNGITFTSQAQINNFPNQYPGVRRFIGVSVFMGII